MYCKHCGCQIDDDALFCSSCGASVANKPSESVNNSFANTESRVTEINQLIDSYEHFSKKQNEYYEYDNLCEGLVKVFGRRLVPLLVWGIIIFVVFSLIALSLATTDTYTYTGIYYVCAFGGALMIFFYIFNAVKRGKAIPKYCQRIYELTNELSNHYVEYGAVSVGIEYTSPKNLNAIILTIKSGRADTVKEALNLLCDTNIKKIGVEDNKRVEVDIILSRFGYKPSVVLYSGLLFN